VGLIEGLCHRLWKGCLTRKAYKLQALDDKMSTKIFGSKRDDLEVRNGILDVQKDESGNFYS
jgi:hypothetical protein